MALGVTASRVVGVSNGDSAVLAFAPGEVTELTSGQPKNPPVGSGTAVGRTFDRPLSTPWRLALMTDGVWKFAGLDRVRSLARVTDPQELLTQLQTTARRPGTGDYYDDFTLAVIDG